MKRINRAAALVLAAVLTLGLMTSCGGEDAPGDNVPQELTVCLPGSGVTLDPAYATEPRDMTVLAHLYENLMKLSADGTSSVVPAMAKSCETEENPDGSVTYTFRLRNAKWSDGVSVTAEDFVYAWQRLADPATHSPNARLLSAVAGFDEVQSTGDIAKLQVSAKNSSTFVVTLTGACEWFLTDVCTSTAAMPLRSSVVHRFSQPADPDAPQAESAAWEDDYLQLAFNGPYCIDSWDGDAMILSQNRRYVGNEDGPQHIVLRFVDTAEEGWTLYENGDVDLLTELPESRLAQLAEDPEWTALPLPTTCTLLFNTAAAPFVDPTVRQAYQLCIDRTSLSRAAGTACAPAGGLVPASVPDADADSFRSHGGDLVNINMGTLGADCDAALALLTENGYDLEFDWAPVELLHPDTERHAETARLLAEQWSAVLNTSVTPVAKPAEELASAIASGAYTLALTDITGYANDAYAFLERWESGSSANVVGYSDSAFDTLLSVIRSVGDDAARRGCLHDAESLLLEDCPLTPLYYTGTAYALRDGLTGLARDARGFFCLSGIERVDETP